MGAGMENGTYIRWRTWVAAVDGDAFCGWMRSALGVEPVCWEAEGKKEARIDVYFGEMEEAVAARGRVGECGIRVRDGGLECLGEEDWTGFWKYHFHAMEVGRSLLTVPVWEEVPESGRTVLRIDPGLSFGTGGHFTTRFCLEALEKAVEELRPRSMLDAGAGSGILAIAAVKLGVEEVAGFDFDPAAVERCGANAELNGLERGRIRFWRQDVREWEPEGRADVVCANILSSVLLGAAGALWEATGRRLILSGIRESEGAEVAAGFERLGARLLRREGDGEWCGLVMERGG